MIEATKILGDKPFKLEIIGPFDAEDLPKDERVGYYGEIRDSSKIKEVLRNADIFVLPSWSEGMPTVILEAMASSCVIVASDVGAVNELVDKENGFFCHKKKDA